MFLNKIASNLKNKSNNLAFFIHEKEYSYAFLLNKVLAVQQKLLKENLQKNDIVLVVTYDDIETYASILAIWFSGGTFVPVNPKHPAERNNRIALQMPIKLKLSSNKNDTEYIYTKDLKAKNTLINKAEINQVLYILFTSGSTGIPKGVPISYKNLHSFITNFANEFKINSKDKFLQIYDLTFDASIHCYVLPLFLGASIFTVSPNKIKYLETYKLLEKHKLTFAKFPPSVLVYLQPFFNRISLPKLKYSLLGGEALPQQLAVKWQKCLPNGKIYNVYGPTEATINTHIFNVTDNFNKTKSYNEIVSIGKPFGNTKAIIIDSNLNELSINNKGELYISGEQITSGYYKNPQKNNNSFLTLNNQRYYKTGDLVFKDQDGDFMYCGRIDKQIQIDGYRIELQEIESIVRIFNQSKNVFITTQKNPLNGLEIILFTENLQTTIQELQDFLKQNLPFYMIPTKIVNLEKFPLLTNGKLDSVKIKKLAN